MGAIEIPSLGVLYSRMGLAMICLYLMIFTLPKMKEDYLYEEILTSHSSTAGIYSSGARTIPMALRAFGI